MAKGKGMHPLWWVVIIVVGASVLGVINLENITSGLGNFNLQTGSAAQPSGGPAATSTASGTCVRQDDGTNTLRVAMRNVDNTTAAYLPANHVVVASDGSVEQGSTALTGGTALAYVDDNVSPCKSGTIYALGSTTVNGMSIPYSSNEMTSNYILRGHKASTLQIAGYTTTFGVDNSSGCTTCDQNGQFLTLASSALSTGGTREGIIEVKTSNPATTWAANGGVLAVDLASTAFSVSNGFSINSQTAGYNVAKIPCPVRVGNYRQADVCFSMPPLSADLGTVRLRYTLRADVGDPTTGPILYFDDKQPFVEDDGLTIVEDYFSASGANAGVAYSWINMTTV